MASFIYGRYVFFGGFNEGRIKKNPDRSKAAVAFNNDVLAVPCCMTIRGSCLEETARRDGQDELTHIHRFPEDLDDFGVSRVLLQVKLGKPGVFEIES